MGKYGSILALVIGLVLAVAIHGTTRVEAPRAGPALPELARGAATSGVTVGDASSAAADLAGAPE